MPTLRLRSIVLFLGLLGLGFEFLFAASGEVLYGQEQVKAAEGEEKSVEDYIRDWESGDYKVRREATRALEAMGAKAVPALTKMIQEKQLFAGEAIRVLTDMGPVAEPALPSLRKLAHQTDAKDPVGWRWNVPLRVILFTNLHKMTWAAEDLIPVLAHVGNNEQETLQIRRAAVSALRGMGSAALPVLNEFIDHPNDTVRLSASNALVQIQSAEGIPTPEGYQRLIDRRPFDSNVPAFLVRLKSAYNHQALHPPTERIKKLYRKRLADAPDPQIAWQLAIILRNGLANTDLQWSAPRESIQSRWRREDPDESYATMEPLLVLAHEHSPRDSELWKKAGLSLAKLRLLRGDWDGMNRVLVGLGQPPVPVERRDEFPAPPLDWDQLASDWQPCDESMRSGNCAVEFRFLRRGGKLQGLPGVHVLIKKKPAERQVQFSGISVDTLFYATHPLLAEPYDSFGYRGGDRAMTRYGVSNDKGVVRFENLPLEDIKVEILVPTSNFAERGVDWQLMMNTPDGIRPTEWRKPGTVDANKPPAVIQLQEGEVVRYPVMFIRSQITSNLAMPQPVGEDFVLQWQDALEGEVDHYRLKLSLSAPTNETSQPPPKLQTEVVETTQRRWELGKKGVGKLALVPGNYYAVDIEALHDDTVVAMLPTATFWVPWSHRQASPPIFDATGRRAFYNDIYFRTSVNGSPLEERLPKLIEQSPEQFETEYRRLGLAWLGLHQNDAEAITQLQQLITELPEGNVVRATARHLLDLAADKKPIPRRFKFVPPGS